MSLNSKSLLEVIDDLSNNLSNNQIERRNEWIRNQPAPRKRQIVDGIRTAQGGMRFRRQAQLRINPTELCADDLNTLTKRWIQKIELPSLLKSGEFEIVGTTDASAPRKSFDSNLLTSSICINSEEGTIEVWSSAKLRRRKQPPAYTLFGIQLSLKGSDRSITDEIEVWGVWFGRAETAIGIAEKLIDDSNLKIKFLATPNNNVKRQVEAFCADFNRKAGAAGWGSNVLKFATVSRGIRDALKSAR